MKVIFLDIDGVLNSHRTVVALGGYGHPNGELKRSELRLDNVAIHLLRVLCEEAPASIVISSTWRHGTPVEYFIKIFAAYGWANAPIISKTPDLPSSFRGDEVKQWLKENGATITHHVILDDDGDFHSGQPLVQTDPREGFRFCDYLAAQVHLGLEPVT